MQWPSYGTNVWSSLQAFCMGRPNAATHYSYWSMPLYPYSAWNDIHLAMAWDEAYACYGWNENLRNSLP